MGQTNDPIRPELNPNRQPVTASSPIRVFWSAVLLLGLLSVGIAAFAEGKSDEEVDHVALAALLIRDEQYDRARTVLAQVDETQGDIDLARLYTLRGLVELHAGDLTGAKDAFRKALDAGQSNPVIHIYLAQVHYGLQEYQDALREIEAGGEATQELPEMHLMASQAHWELGERTASWNALESGARRFPGNGAILRRKIFFLIELGLYQEAAALGREYLSKAGISQPEDSLAIGNALRRSGQTREAARFLEMARLQLGSHRDLMLELTHAYIDMGWLHAAAGVLEQAAGQHLDLAAEAAEIYRRAGRLYRALTLNAHVQDQQKKLKQRLALLMELERYDEATAMAEALSRVGLLDDEDLRYALAYAYFRTNQYQEAETHLAKLSRPDLFRKAAEIRRAMDDHRDVTVVRR